MDEQRDGVEETDQSKRQLVAKLLAVAGAAAVADMLGGTGAEGADITQDKHSAFQLSRAGTSAFKFHKSSTGFRITVSGRQMGEVLRSAGLLRPDANPDNATIAIEFTA